MASCSAALHAQSVALPPPAKPQPAVVAPTKPAIPSVVTAKPPATNAAPVFPPAMQNTLGRYGNILVPGDQVPYPLKLKLPFPGEAEVRLPKKDDLVKREKLEELAKLSDDDIRKQLSEWPAYSKMNLRDQAAMLQRIQDFRDYHARVAQQKAHEMGLLTLTPDQKTKFEKEYWDKRLKVDEDLVKQFAPLYQARVQKMDDELFREFSSNAAVPAPPVPQPPKPAPAPAAKPTPPVAATATPNATNVAPPIAQNK